MERRVLLLVCIGVNIGMGGVLRWFGNGSFWRLDLEERSRGISLYSGGEVIFRFSCGGDLRGEKVIEVFFVCCSVLFGILAGCGGAEFILGVGSKGCGVGSILVEAVEREVFVKGLEILFGVGWVLVLLDGEV